MGHNHSKSFKIHFLGIWVGFLMFIAACSTAESPTVSQEPSGMLTQSPSTPTRTATLPIPSPSPTQTRTAGPSPTSTPLPAMASRRWGTNDLIIELASLSADPLARFSYTPIFILYSDGQLFKRDCQDSVCQYAQTQLDQTPLCRLINAVDRTGFLNADPEAFQLPPGTDLAFRLSVGVDQENTVTIPDLAQWATSPNWYDAYAGCSNCYPEPIIDPAFIDLFQLLAAYTPQTPTIFQSNRLAVGIGKPIISGTPRPWPEEVIPLSELVERSTCDDPTTNQAVILEGSQAQAIAELLSAQSDLPPIFTDGEFTWQVQSRWLLPYEMPQTCQTSAGIYPPTDGEVTTWRCEPEMGAFPTSTATITPTPSITPTPLR